jgi:pimeloyl-ACP methyl ester carboxylesterase
MAPVARRLSMSRGILEPLQTGLSIDAQVMELRQIIELHGVVPMTLVGWSWGAWLSYIFAARHPSLTSKLILVGSGPFTAEYAATIWPTRMGRLSLDEQGAARAALEQPSDPVANKAGVLRKLERLLSKADSYDPLTLETEVLEYQPATYQHVWAEAEAMRQTGRLLELAHQIRCPVVAIHGDHDPHPAEGVRVPLLSVLQGFRFVLLDRCGHTPWVERHARERFFRALEEELG